MKDDRVMSADNFKVIDDSRISVLHMNGKGSRLEIRQLKQSDSGQFSCIVNLKQKPLKVIHTLQIQGTQSSFSVVMVLLFICSTSQNTQDTSREWQCYCQSWVQGQVGV